MQSRTMCELGILDIISFDDEEGEPNVLNVFLDVVGQSKADMLVESFLEDEELAETALLSVDGSLFARRCKMPGSPGTARRWEKMCRSD